MTYEDREKMKKAIWAAARAGVINARYNCSGVWAGEIFRLHGGFYEFAERVCGHHPTRSEFVHGDHRHECPAWFVADMNDAMIDREASQEEVARSVCKFLDELPLED